MPTIIIPKAQVERILFELNCNAPTLQSVTIDVSKRHRPIAKGELLHLYFKNLNKKLEKLSTVKCKATEDLPKGQRLTIRNTYDRKYYLNRKVKAAGFKLELEQTSKTIEVTPEMAAHAEVNKAVKELSMDYNYGVQYTLI
jgi:hypothetical protein